MKRLLFFIILFFSLSLAAQNTLTFGEVYDFNLGDVLQTTSESQAGNATEYVTQTIIGKQFSAQQDTIVYKIRQNRYVKIDVMGAPNINETDTISLVVSNLNTSFDCYNSTSSCVGTAETLEEDTTCGTTRWLHYPLPVEISATCFEPNVAWTWAIKGLGGPYFTQISGQNGKIDTKHLSYYKKGIITCGEYVTATKDLDYSFSDIHIYPNPTQNRLHIKSSQTLKKATLVTVYGQRSEVLMLKDDTIDLINVEKGIYFLILQNSANQQNVQKVIKF
jgi:Secretion system C-terminal sorting domain